MVVSRRGFVRLAGGAAAAALTLPHGTFAGTATASDARAATADVSDVVRRVHAKHKVPGLVGAVVDLDGAAAEGAAGIRKVGAREQMTAGDKIHLGSCTKAMTATLVGRLMEEGKVSMGTTMRQAFPALAGRMNRDMAAVTVAQLMRHRGGLPANVDWWAAERSGRPVTAQRMKIVEQVLSSGPAQRVGTYLYSNVGFVTLGAIVEQARRKPWEDVIGAEFFAPLGMSSAAFGAPGTPGRVDQPWGHEPVGNTLTPRQFDNVIPLGPAGRVHCTIADWGKYVAWCLRAWRADTPLLRRATEIEIVTPAPGEDYSGGWVTTRRAWAGGTALNHNGTNTTWFCTAWVAPLKGFAVLSATNVAGADAANACDGVASGLIDWWVKRA